MISSPRRHVRGGTATFYELRQRGIEHVFLHPLTYSCVCRWVGRQYEWIAWLIKLATHARLERRWNALTMSSMANTNARCVCSYEFMVVFVCASMCVQVYAVWPTHEIVFDVVVSAY